MTENDNHIQAVILLFQMYREKFGPDVVCVGSNSWDQGVLFEEIERCFSRLSDEALVSLNYLYRGRCLIKENGIQEELEILSIHYSFLSNAELTLLNNELKSMYDEYKQRNNDSEPKQKKQKRFIVLPENVEQFLQECLVWFSDILKRDLDFFMYTIESME